MPWPSLPRAWVKLGHMVMGFQTLLVLKLYQIYIFSALISCVIKRFNYILKFSLRFNYILKFSLFQPSLSVHL